MTGAAAAFAGVGISGSGSGSGFSVSVPPSAVGSNTGAAASGTVTSSAAVTVSGGTAPYSYLWSRRGGDPSISLTNTTTATVGLSATVSNFDTPKQCTIGVRVTDSLGVRVDSNDCDVSLEWIDTR